MLACSCFELESSRTKDKLFKFVAEHASSNRSVFFFSLVFRRRSSQRSTWLPTSTRAAWWTCRSTKVAPKWSGKALKDRERALVFQTHLHHAICDLPQRAGTKGSCSVLFSSSERICVDNLGCTLRNQGCNVTLTCNSV